LYRASSCEVPVVKIEQLDYGSQIKSIDFHFAPLEHLKSTLPYPHRHDFYHIAWVTNGSGHHIIDSVRYNVQPSTLFFMAPGQVHDFAPSRDVTGFSLNFSAEFIAFKMQSRKSLTDIPIFDFENRNSAVHIDDAQSAPLRVVLDSIIEEYANEAAGFEDVIWSYLRIFLIQVSRIAAPDSIAHLSKRSHLLARRFKSALDKNFTTMNQTVEYARMLKVTERALNEATREALGSTAAQLIRERTMLEAKRLLLHSDISIAEIAERLSFDDPAYFSRCFKKHTTRSPIEFRKSMAIFNL
jgi:AraC family transcriptional activator of pobA